MSVRKPKQSAMKPRPKRLSLHPLSPQEALRHALSAGKVEKRQKAGKEPTHDSPSPGR